MSIGQGDVSLAIEADVAKLTLERTAKLNSVTPDMLLQLEEHLKQIDRSRDVRVVILTGAGERAFTVGADINAWAALEPIDMWRRWVRDGHRVFDLLAGLRQPTIAMLNGLTLGGGLELALACDLRIAAEHVQLGCPEVKIGTVPGWGGTQRLASLIGAARAKQMIFTGAHIDARQAESWGLVNECVPGERLARRVDDLANEIAQNAPIAVQIAKQIINGGLGSCAGATFEALAGALAASTDDGREGIASFRAKRSATYNDR